VTQDETKKPMSYLLVFFTFSLIITLHELGHLLAAKRAGIPIARFSVGFGPKLWGFKIGETEYWICMIPCGGYVLPAVANVETFQQIPLRRHILFALGGPAANIVGAFLGLSLMNAVRSGFSMDAIFYHPVEQICGMAAQIFSAVPSLFRQPDQLSGVVGIVATGGVWVGLNFARLLQFWVLLNLNVAIFNLIPLLPLDGGKILMGVLRKIHQPLRKLELPLAVGGWVLLLGLTVYATVLDVSRMAHGIVG
jgi:regulator of sigma E protease